MSKYNVWNYEMVQPLDNKSNPVYSQPQQREDKLFLSHGYPGTQFTSKQSVLCGQQLNTHAEHAGCDLIANQPLDCISSLFCLIYCSEVALSKLKRSQ